MLTPPIPVALPLLVAALLAALNRLLPRWLASTLAILTSAAVGCVAVSMLVYSRLDPIVYWFGGWVPRRGAALGIGFVIDGPGAMLVLLASILVTASLVFSTRYFDTVGTLFPSLMLIFLAAMSGFSQTGDLFNLFVFFELMSAAAFALCGYKSEEPGPLQGALNFAVTNTVGAFLILSGIGLIYGRTGALNMAQIGRALGNRADALTLVALAFIACGFLVKAAIVPFHFWLADAHAVAPAPVCVLFSGVMVELGLYAVTRVYWACFSGILEPRQGALRNLLLVFGVATALLGAVMCYAQRHLKRMLAFSTISHMGAMLLGVALLAPRGLAGAELYAMGHAMVKGGLFLAAGILLHRTASVDEMDLRGRGRQIQATGALFVLGAAGLAGLPPFATFWAANMMDASARELGLHWLPWVSFAAATATAAALLRFWARVFLGWGPNVEELPTPGGHVRERPDTSGGHHRTPAAMYLPAAGLLALGLLAGLAPRLTGAAYAAAIHIQDRGAYAQRVLDMLTPYPAAVQDQPAAAGDFARGAAGLLLALAAAWMTLCWNAVRRTVGRSPIARALVGVLRAAHSGIIPDYVTWLIFGVAAFGAASLIWLR